MDNREKDELQLRYLMKVTVEDTVKENMIPMAQEIARETAKQVVQDLQENYIPKDEYYEHRNKWIDAQMKREEELRENWKSAKWKTITTVISAITLLLMTNAGSTIWNGLKKLFGGD